MKYCHSPHPYPRKKIPLFFLSKKLEENLPKENFGAFQDELYG
jgi:hypothetical protein